MINYSPMWEYMFFLISICSIMELLPQTISKGENQHGKCPDNHISRRLENRRV